MAISRMNMERQMRNMGGIMGLEDQRQGYFLGKLVKKITKPIKKIVKSPLGKIALLGGLGAYAGGLGPFAGMRGAGFAKGIGGGLSSLFGTGGKLSTIGDIFRVGGEAGKNFSALRLLGGGLGAAALAAPFLMGDEEEVVDEESFTGPISSIEDIRSQAKAYYNDPTNSALYFMPPKSAVRSSFYAADGGLADIPREGYNQGERVEGILKKISMLTPSGIGMAAGKKMAEGIKEDENIMMAGMGNVMKFFENNDGSFDRDAFEDMLIQYEDSGAKANGIKLMDFAVDFLGISSMKEGGRVPMQEGGIMDLGGMEKDYREGGFVPLGAEERADDVPARLSKNEFVFTADAVRNAGQGDIDRGAKVMQNMMDNLEAGGTISEESQGEENPAQAMFDQAQQLESRIA